MAAFMLLMCFLRMEFCSSSSVFDFRSSRSSDSFATKSNYDSLVYCEMHPSNTIV